MLSYTDMQAGVEILKGLGQVYLSKAQSKAASKIRDAQLSAAKQTYEYNKKELQRAYSKNFTNLMIDYAYQKSNFLTEANQASAELSINMSLAQSDVDLTGSSFSTDSFNELDQQLADGMRNLQLSQTSAMENMFDQFNNANLQNQQTLSSTNQAIQNSYIQAKQQADLNKSQGYANILVSSLSLGTRQANNLSNQGTGNIDVKSNYQWNQPLQLQYTTKDAFSQYLQNKTFNTIGSGK